MAQTIYTKAEKYLLSLNSYLAEVPTHELEELAEDIVNTNFESVGFGIELGRCSSTDNRTYILHTGKNGEAYYEQYINFTWLKPKKLQHLKE